jgi:hypothetical protein
VSGGAIRSVATLLLGTALAASLAGCLGDGPSAAPTPTRTPEPTPVSTTYEIGAKVWYEGLVLTIDRATATLDDRGGPVDVLVAVENPGAEAAALDAAISLVVGGVRTEPTRDSQVPSAPGGGSVAAILRFELQGVPSVDDAVLEVGAAPEHVGRVALARNPEPPRVFEPSAFDLSGSATAGALKLTLRTGLLRWDLPDWSQQLDAGVQALTLTYDATYAGDFAGGFPFTGDNVALRLPDGKLINSRRDGHSQSIELIGARKTKKGLSSRFEIPAGVTGKFALVVRSAGATKAITFAIGD